MSTRAFSETKLSKGPKHGLIVRRDHQAVIPIFDVAPDVLDAADRVYGIDDVAGLGDLPFSRVDHLYS